MILNMQNYVYLVPMEFKYITSIIKAEEKYVEISELLRTRTEKKRIVNKTIVEDDISLWKRINTEVAAIKGASIYHVETLYKQYASSHVRNCIDSSTETTILGYRVFVRQLLNPPDHSRVL